MKYLRLLIPALMLFFKISATAQTIYLNEFQIVTSGVPVSNAEKAASQMLSEEIKKRTGLRTNISSTLPATGNIILLRQVSAVKPENISLSNEPVMINKPESYRLSIEEQNGRHVIVVEGFDGRGVLFGAGQLLRDFIYKSGAVGIPEDLSVSTTPSKSIRGHQLGYRNTANSYDAWTVAQFEQYIRELVIFGTNSIESIPIFDEEKSPHFKLPPDEMNSHISSICEKYDLDYWIWVPTQFDLKDTVKRNQYLQHLEKIFSMSVRLNGVFFPGGDPGDNPPETVWPLLIDIAKVLKKYHPGAQVWLSLQNYTPAQNQTVYRYVQEQMPDWLGGLVTGPSSPPVEETRAALPPKYKLRYYPDVTHNVRCDWGVPWWDPVFNFTLGRESVNPRAMQYRALYHFLEPFMDGFISYSDGIHDDVNKIVWTRLAWDGSLSEREILVEYSNFFFNSRVSQDAADGLLALETNWQGPAFSNGGIQTTWMAWKQMELMNPALESNWRWQMYLLRANYDAYSRNRGIYEAALEEKANEVLRQAPVMGSQEAMRKAQSILEEAVKKPIDTNLRNRVIALCDALYHSIGLQTSVKKYGASGEERGAVLDFLDYPLNDRWWMEDRFAAIKNQPAKEQLAALEGMANWENPGPGGYYDDIGNVAKSAHVLRGEPWTTDPLTRKQDSPNYSWWDEGSSRQRLSFMSSMRWPVALEYNGLDSTKNYMIRTTGFGECLLKINGQRVAHTKYGKGIGEIKEFPVPADLIKNGKISLTFDDINEDNINWRQQSRLTEVWLIKLN
jgi:Glycosyl hydrolase family 20, domain 2